MTLPAVGAAALIGAGVTLYRGAASATSQLFGHYPATAPWSRSVDAPRRVALTVDGSPPPELLRVLAERRIVATFFVTGEQARQQPQVVVDAVAGGHELGNGLSGPRCALLRHSTSVTLLRSCDDALFELTGLRPRLVRPPAGIRSPALLRAVRDLGMQAVSGVQVGRARPAVAAQRSAPGDIAIVRLSPGHPAASHRVAAYVDALRDRGYLCTTASELLLQRPYRAAGTVTTCAPPRPAHAVR